MYIFNRTQKQFCFAVSMAAVFAFPFSLSASGTWLPFERNNNQTANASEDDRPAMRFIERSLDRYVIDYEFPGAVLTLQTENQTPYYHLSIDQFGKLNNPGLPALPARLFSFAVPNGHTAVVKVLSSTSSTPTGYTVCPAKKPAADKIGAEEPKFEIDADFYNSDRVYPEQPVSINNEIVFRGCHIARVQVCPVLYNPAQKKLITYSKIRFEISFISDKNATQSAGRENRSTRTSNLLLANIADNAGMIIEQDDLLKNTATDGQTDAVPTPAGGLVIVTIDSYLTAANTLADWKRRMGFNVVVLSQASWTTAAVKSAIYNQYSSMPGGLDFALILGDHPDVPAEISSLGSASHATDLYYGCMDGSSDFTPDIGLGRISVSSAAEAATVVQKIIKYEKTPVADAAFYNHATSAAYFQHAGSGYEERRFTLTSWEILQYLTGNFGYAVDREFYTESSVSPLYWNNGYYSNGAAIPAELQRPTYGWDGDAAGISAGINEGRFFVFHRDHGDITLWGDPSYTVSNINSLTNGDLLPVVFSINCLTGQFDYSGVCFSEAFLRHPSGGAVGVFCATEVSYSGQNDGLAPGMIDAIWPTPGLVPAFPHNPSPSVTPHAPMYSMGMVLTQGKIRMSETWNGGSEPFNYEQYTYELFHYLGDPTMRIWTAAPQTITATHAAAVMIGQESFVISGATCADGIATLSFDGQIIGACQLSGGSGTMTLEPVPSTTGTAELTITAHNYRPYLQNIDVIPGGDAIIISVPSNGALYDQGATVPLAWQTFGTIPNVKIEFSSNNGATYTTIIPSTVNNNGYSWTAATVESDQCILRVSDIDGTPVDESGTFSIHELSSISGTVVGTVPAQVNYSGPQSGSTTTQATGDFSINQLMPGTYQLFAESNGFQSGTTQLSVPPDHTGVTLTINYPDISVTPSSLALTLAAGATGTRTVAITNNGTAPLVFSAEPQQINDGAVAPAEAVYPASHFLPIDRETADMRVGLPVSEGSGGPDTYGYSWIDSDQSGGPAFVWNDISSTGTLLSEISNCLDCYEQVNLGFSFEYYGVPYSTMYVSSKGTVMFGSGSYQYTNYALPSTSAPASMIACFWDDLDPSEGGDIYFQDFGDHAVVQYTAVSSYSGTASLTFQIHLLADGKIRFYYQTMSGTLTSATVGQQNQTRDDGFTIAYNTTYIKNNLAIEISRKPDWLSVSPENGTLQPGMSVDLSVSFDASELTAGAYTANLNILHNDPDATYPLAIPCALTVVESGNLPPAAVMSAVPTSGMVPLTVAFDGSASTDPDGDALSYAWNFGDGSTGSGATASHVYTAAGTYSATLTVNDGNGGTDDSTATITVTPASYTITASAGTGGSITPSGAVSVQHGSSQTFTIAPSTGYRISNVLVDGASVGTVNSYTFTSVTAAHTISASFDVIALDTVYRINCGGSAASPYTADQYYSGGKTYSVTSAITTPSSITNPAPQSVYKTERYGNMTYTFPNLTPGSPYIVRLHFAELYWTASGSRLFNVAINGSAVLTNFDIYALTGGRYIAEVIMFTTTANSSGQIIIQFTTVTDNAKIDGIEIIETIPNAPPTIVTAASATPNPVAASTTVLSVLADDDNGEESLTYTWEPSGATPALVTFSANGTNAAKTVTATFTKAGSYPLLVRVSDQGGLAVTSDVTVTVDQTLTSIVVSPSTATVQTSAAQQFTATARDQFAEALTVQLTISWSASSGSIDQSGLFTAGTVAGTSTITATSGSIYGTATVTITIPNAAPTIATAASADPDPVTASTTALSVLGDDDNGEENLTYTWATVGTPPAAVSFSTNGTNGAKNTTATFTKAGAYSFQVTVRDEGNLTATSTVAVTVNQTLTSIVLSPPTAALNVSATQQFTAVARDQFAANLAVPPTFTWSVSGVGTVSGTGLYTAGTTAGSATVRAQSGTVSGTASVTVTAEPTIVYQINTGSNSAASPFSADQFGSGGTLHSVTNTIDRSGVTDPAPQAVYQSERYGNSTYTIPNLTPTAAYIVRLHFAEIYWTASGSRRFNVAINGTTVLSNFDIYAQTGARYKAIVREFTATANGSGQIVIVFTTVTDNATIEGIEIIRSTPNYPPTIATAAAAAPSPVTGTTTTLSVLGDDDNGEANLTYTWSTTGTPPAAVTFSTNGTNAAKTTTATFTKAGNYTFQATVRDQGNLTATSSVAVTVDQTFTGIIVSPSIVTVQTSATQQFTATALDQFAAALAAQPEITWNASSGSINAGGLFTAGTSAGTATVTAASGSISGTAAVTVTVPNAAPTIATAASATPDPVTGTTTALLVLGDDDNGEENLTYTWATTGTIPAAVTFSANGTNAAKATTATFAKAGSYTFQVTVRDQGNLTVTSTVAVTVVQTLTGIVVSPSTATVQTSATRQFTAAATDQFGSPVTAPSLSWTVNGGGTISTSGLFTAGQTAGGPYTVTATSGPVSGTAQITVEQVQTGIVVYDDQLASGYADYSWSGTYNPNDASPVKVGSKSYSITYTSGWAGLQLQKTSGTQTHTGFTKYTFWAHGGTSGTRKCQFFTRNNSGQESNHVTVDIPANTWTLFTITLSALGNPTDAKTILLQECSGSAQPEFNIDQLELQ